MTGLSRTVHDAAPVRCFRTGALKVVPPHARKHACQALPSLLWELYFCPVLLWFSSLSFTCAADRQPIIQEENDGDLTVTDTCPQTTPRGASVPSSSCVSISQLEPCCATEPASPDLATEVGTIAGPATPAIQQQQQDTELVQQVASSDENQQHQAETVLSNHGSIRRKCLDPTPAVHFGIQLESSPQGRGDATTPVPPLTQLLQLCNQEVIQRLPLLQTARICW